MRALADELGVSVITTKSAYNELEAEGLIVTVVGRGSFVSNVPSKETVESSTPIEESVSAAINDAKSSGMTVEEALELVKRMYREE